MSRELAPIILFVYNRPEHTAKTLEALSLNDHADKSMLFIFCDGPKDNASPEILQRIEKVRTIVRSKQWCKENHIIESQNNKGLASSIKDGVSQVVNNYGKVIVMEDDLITSTAFLTFMNDSLRYYENYKSVFSITGYNLPSSKMKIPEDYNYDVYVCLRNGSWGWATWSDRWNKIDWDIRLFETMDINKSMKEALNRGGDDVFKLLQMQKNGKLNIWSIQFTLTHFVNHAITISPTLSYVDNIGVDGTGENCGTDGSYRNSQLNQNRNIRFLDILYEDSRLLNAFYNAYCQVKRPIWQKIINRISRSLGRENVFQIKKKIYA